MLTIAHVLNFLLMLSLPLLLGAGMTRRFGLPWGLFGWGALTFVVSQLLHIPFNQFVLVPWLVDLGFPERGVGLVVGALLLGLSAGLFEELARYVVLSRSARGARSWRSALLYGAGHGGVEAFLLGGLALYGFIQAVALRNADLSALFGPEELALAQQQLETYWGMPPGLALLGAVERVFAIVVQMSAALMVVIAVMRAERRWLAAAIVWHTAVDAAAVYLAQRVNVYAAEFSVFGMALLAVAFIFWARRSGLIPLENPDDDLSGELRPGSSRLRNRAFEDRISEEIDQSRYL